MKRFYLTLIFCYVLNGCFTFGTNERAEALREYKVKKEEQKKSELTKKLKEKLKKDG